MSSECTKRSIDRIAMYEKEIEKVSDFISEFRRFILESKGYEIITDKDRIGPMLPDDHYQALDPHLAGKRVHALLYNGRLKMLILHAYHTPGLKQLLAASEALERAGFICRFDQNYNLHNPSAAIVLCAEVPETVGLS